MTRMIDDDRAPCGQFRTLREAKAALAEFLDESWTLKVGETVPKHIWNRMLAMTE